MPLFNWPYTDLHNLNLDWIIRTIKKLNAEVKDFSPRMREYINEWLENHPEATTTVQDKAVTYKKTNMPLGLHEPYIVTDRIITNIAARFSTAGYTLQGGTYYQNAYYMAFADTSFDNVIIIKSITGESIDGQHTIRAGHANSLKIHNGYMYIACRDTGAYPNRIIKCSLTDMSVIDTYVFNSPWAIAFNDNIAYVGDSDGLHICDAESLNIIKSESYTPGDYIKPEHVSQDLIVIDDTLIAYGAVLSNNVWTGLYLQAIDNNLHVVNSVILPVNNRGDEAEFITQVNNEIVAVTGQYNLTFYKIAADTVIKHNDIFQAPKAIKAYDDLNKYTTPGAYNVAASSEIASIYNAPSTVAFDLYVLPYRSHDVIQIAFDYEGMEYLRVYTADTDSWTQWTVKCLDIDKRSNNISLPAQAFGHLTNAKRRIVMTVPTSQFIRSGTNINITGSFTARSTSGTIVNGGNFSDYTITVSRNVSGVLINIDSNTDFTSADINNTPLVIGLSGTLSFS
jgi:hypothetical protein